jgi:hypothetical protein
MQSQALTYKAVGPFCPLLSQGILRQHVEVLAAKRRCGGARRVDAALSLQAAKEQVKRRQRGQAEWTYAALIQSLVGVGGGDGDRQLAEAFFALALVAQKRDVALARYAFRLALRTVGAGDAAASRKYLVSWGLFESKQPGPAQQLRAQMLLTRAVELDASKAPVLKWKCGLGGAPRCAAARCVGSTTSP